MNNMQKYIDFYNNTYSGYIHQKLKAIFPNNYKVIRHYLRKHPITNTLVDDISILFKNQPQISY